MKKKFSWKKLSAIGMGAIMALSLAFGLGFSNISLNGTEKPDSANSNLTQNVEGGGTNSVVSNYAASADIVEPSSDTTKLPTFKNDYVYWYTDFDEGVKFSSKTDGVETDVKTVTVTKSGNAAGSKNNPWVINSVSDWNVFVSYVAGVKVGTTNTYGSGEYFVLNCDLDYTTVTNHYIEPVYKFAGTFYGNGYAIKNARIHSDNILTTDYCAMGLFCYIMPKTDAAKHSDAYISDISVENYTINDNVWAAAPIVAITQYPLTLVNCRAAGSITATPSNTTKLGDTENVKPPYIPQYPSYAGILAHAYGRTKNSNGAYWPDTSPLKLYKCVADFTLNFTCTLAVPSSSDPGAWPMLGGLTGEVENMGNFYVYDCYAAMKGTTNTKTVYWNFFGFLGFNRNIQATVVKNCLFIADMVSTTNKTTTNTAHFAAGYLNTPATITGKSNRTLSVENFYANVNVKNNNVQRKLNLMDAYSVNEKAYDSISIKSTSQMTTSAGTTATSNGTSRTAANENGTVRTKFSDFLNDAKTGLSNTDIWDSAVIAEIGEIQSNTLDKPDIIETPIILGRTRVAYYEYKDETSEAYANAYGAGETAGDWKAVKVDEDLYDPSIKNQVAEGRVFLGWTNDKTGATAPVKQVPKTWHGDIKIYAVWGIDEDANITASSEIGAKQGSRELTYGENGFEIVYNATNGVKLYTKNIEVSGVGGTGNSVMSDAVAYEWQWMQGNTNKATGETYTVMNVKDSGNYKVTLKYHSANEPLFMGTLTLDAKQVTITKAPLYLYDCWFESTVHPYSGAPFTSAKPTASVKSGKNGTGNDITGTTGWYISGGKFNMEPDNNVNEDGSPNLDVGHVVVENGKLYEIKTIWFQCDESYNGNYGDPDEIDEGGHLIERNGQKFEFKFQIEYVQFLFKITDYEARSTVYVNLQYGQSYTYYNVAAMFEEAFKNDMNNFPGLTPVFRKESTGDMWTINEYRNETGTAYMSVSENCELTVSFEEETYEVTYDPKNDKAPFADDASPVGYGIRANEPRPAPVNGDKLFLGWYYKVDVVDENGNVTKDVEKKWDFVNDLVTREMHFYARWLTADTLEPELDVKIDPSAVFNANAELDTSLLTVTATFSANNKEFTSEAVLTSGQYTIDYGQGNIDGRLHVKVDEDGNILPTTVTVHYEVTIGGKKQEASKVLELDLERFRVPTENLKEFFYNTAVEWEDGVSKENELLILPADIRNALLSSYITSEIEYVYAKNGQPVLPGNLIEVGTYVVQANFKTTSPDYYAPPITATLEIVPEKITLTLSWDKDEFDYNGKAQMPAFTFKYADNEDREATVNYTVVDTHTHTGDEVDKCLDAVKVSSYSVKVVLKDSGYQFENKSSFMIVPFTIKKVELQLPKQIEPLDYIGAQYNLNKLDPDIIAEYFENFDPDMMEVGEGATGTNVDSYTAFITLKDPNSAKWASTVKTVTMDWEIKKAQLSVFWGNKKSFEENGEVQYPKVVRFIGLVGTDSTAVDLDKDIKYNLAGIKADVGGYTVSMSFNSSASWAKNYELDDTKSFSFAIVPMGAGNVTLLTVEWVTTSFKFNEDWQKPKFKLLDEDNNDVTDEYIDSILCDGEDWNSYTGKMWAGKYDVTLSIDPDSEYGDTHFLVGKTNCTYQILKDGTKGEDPNGSKPDDEGKKPNDNTLTGLPLWQLIVGGVSALLFVFCTLKAIGEFGKLKTAKREAKELAAQSYYSFVPLPLLAMGAGVKFLGLEETPWTVIALVAVGLFLISAVALFMITKKRKAAELMVKREQARIAEEKEYMREEERREEQARRDNEMKMMFAAMQQGYQQQPQQQMPYEDLRGLLAETVSALLPAMQQMQALPPAQSDPNAYAQPNYGAPNYGGQTDYNARAEADALRAQMAEQQARMEAQMAQQQELINQLLQNQQAQQSAPAYEEEEDISWLGENDEVVSLEESYGALSDEGKRAYYDIGSYIMGKPRTSQNDGRYAVLFKYRGRTLFKLCIKDNAPVLYYPAGGGRGEVVISDASALEVAKSMVDRSVSAVDSELN